MTALIVLWLGLPGVSADVRPAHADLWASVPGAGAACYQRSRPERLRPTATAEVALALAVLAVTAVLALPPPPRSTKGAPALEPPRAASPGALR